MPPSFPRASHTALMYARQYRRGLTAVSGLGMVPESVEALHDEITDIQRTLDAEAEILRKAMALLESRKHGNILQGLGTGDLHGFSKRMMGAAESPSPFPERAAESTFPFPAMGATTRFRCAVLARPPHSSRTTPHRSLRGLDSLRTRLPVLA